MATLGDMLVESLTEAVRMDRTAQEKTPMIDPFAEIDGLEITLTIGEYNTLRNSVNAELESLRNQITEITEQRDALSDSLTDAQTTVADYQRTKCQPNTSSFLNRELMELRAYKRNHEGYVNTQKLLTLMTDLVHRRDTNDVKKLDLIMRDELSFIAAIKRVRTDMYPDLIIDLKAAKELVESYLVLLGYRNEHTSRNLFFEAKSPTGEWLLFRPSIFSEPMGRINDSQW